MNWKSKLKHYSTQALAAAAAIPGLWLAVPDEVKLIIPADKMAVITAAVALAGLAGKFVPQGKPEEKAADRILDGVKKDVVERVKSEGVELAKREIIKAVAK